MSGVLDFQIRDYMREIYPENRWGLLTVLMLHSNIRNRCWPSMKTLAYEMQLSPNKVSAAKRWLLEHKAITLVQYKLRIDEEKRCGPRQHVYQLTGTIMLDGQSVPYLYHGGGDTFNVTDGDNIELATPVNVTDHSNIEEVNVTDGDVINGGNLSNIQYNTEQEENTNTYIADAIDTFNPDDIQWKPVIVETDPDKTQPMQYGDMFVLIREHGFGGVDTKGINERVGKLTKALLKAFSDLSCSEFVEFVNFWALKGIDFPSGEVSLVKAVGQWRYGKKKPKDIGRPRQVDPNPDVKANRAKWGHLNGKAK